MLKSSQFDHKVVENTKFVPNFDISVDVMCNNITIRDQVGAPLKFLKLTKDSSFYFHFFSVPKITPRNTPGIRKPLFSQQEKQKIHFLNLFSEKPHCAEKKLQLAKLNLKPK